MKQEEKQEPFTAAYEIIMSIIIIIAFFLPWFQVDGFGNDLMRNTSIPKLIDMLTSMAQNFGSFGKEVNGQLYLIYLLYTIPVLATGNIISRLIGLRVYKAIPLYVSSLALLEVIVFIWIWQQKLNGMGSMGAGAIITLISSFILWVITIVNIIRHYRENQLLIKIHLIIPMVLAAILIFKDIQSTSATISAMKELNIEETIFKPTAMTTFFGALPLIFIILLFGLGLFLFWRALKKTPRETLKVNSETGNQETIPTNRNPEKPVEITGSAQHEHTTPTRQTNKRVEDPTQYMPKNHSEITLD